MQFSVILVTRIMKFLKNIDIEKTLYKAINYREIKLLIVL